MDGLVMNGTKFGKNFSTPMLQQMKMGFQIQNLQQQHPCFNTTSTLRTTTLNAQTSLRSHSVLCLVLVLLVYPLLGICSMDKYFVREEFIYCCIAGKDVCVVLAEQNSPKQLKLHVDVFDEVGIAGAASGVAGGLVHPYSPKVKLLWRGEECWTEFLNLLNVAQAAAATPFDAPFIVRKTGILRPAVSDKNLDVMHQNAHSCLATCPIQTIDEIAAKKLMPSLCTPYNTAFFMPEAVNVNPRNYLKALFLASENLVERMSSMGFNGKSIALHKRVVTSLSEVGGEYDAVIVCLGAKASMLPELSGMLPLRMCRGIVAHLQLHDSLSEEYCKHSPSILSDAWLAVQGPRNLYLGSTWEWGSKNYSSVVSSEEASSTLEQLLPKISMVYPQITNWSLTGAQAGVRAMPPLTSQGSYPLLGCIDHLVRGTSHRSSKYWLIGGLSARGLLYHGWLGKLTAQAVLSSSEDVLPSELTSWKKMKKQ